ncbi:MAG: flippase-like domain-containing protein [Alphaproteobacteria bacterium]|nr:flippase-like domain-containing protein [Alphaproteobacteria bacterium]MDE2514189.1 flippase-like domain-containing protein [Alphaproteobacteria bacterium]
MRAWFALCAIVGVLSGGALVAWQGFASVGSTLELAGLPCLAVICLYHVVPFGCCAEAWRILLRNPKPGIAGFIWFRWVRDAGGDILGIIPAGGEMAGIHTMIAHGVEPALAAASTVVDITIEMSAQVAFTILGATLLIVRHPGNPMADWMLGGIWVVLVFAGGFFVIQRLGVFRLLERLADHLIVNQGWSRLASLRGIHDHIEAIYADRPRIGRALMTHFGAWIVGCGEASIILYFMGAPLGIASIVTLESLAYAIRSAAFFVPAAAGVQEGGYILIGATLGLGPELALALSLMKRARELTLGITGLLAWQWFEGRFLLRARRARR